MRSNKDSRGTLFGLICRKFDELDKTHDKITIYILLKFKTCIDLLKYFVYLHVVGHILDIWFYSI